MFPPSLAAKIAMNSPACGAGTRISRRHSSALCPNAPGLNACDVWAWRFSSPLGVTPRGKVRRPKGAGSGAGSSMIPSCANTADYSDSSADGGAAHSNTPCTASMASCSSGSWAMASSSSRSTLPSVGPIPKVRGGAAQTNSTCPPPGDAVDSGLESAPLDRADVSSSQAPAGHRGLSSSQRRCYYGHLVLRLIAGFALFYTSRFIFKGHVTMEEMGFTFKHYWRTVDYEPFDLYAIA